MLRQRAVLLLASLFLGLPTPIILAAGKAEHIVVVVWDGLRPDSVSRRQTPVLYRLSRQGVFFTKHHAVYPSSTEVNGAALATGGYPAHTGIVGNREYRPDIESAHEIRTEELAQVIKGDRLSAGKHLGLPTIAETVQAAGYPTAIAGTKGVALFQDRMLDRVGSAATNSVDVFGGAAMPPDRLEAIVGARGTFPKVAFPNISQDQWTTGVLTEHLWRERVPKFSLLWLSEPDYSQHHSGPGSKDALAGLASSDRNLGKVLRALDARKIRDKTDVLIVSDHGFSTISRKLDLVMELNRAGLKAVRETPQAGEILVVGNGGSALFYVIGRDRALIEQLIGVLQDSDFAGPIFTREPQAGCFTANEARIDSPNEPDVVMAMRWSAKRNKDGVAGSIVSYDPNAGTDGQFRVEGNGHHASMSAYDMHNTLIAAGPDFRAGIRSDVPSGNADLAPTILSLLALEPRVELDGRVLSEALTNDSPKAEVTSQTFDARTPRPNFVWHQFIRVTKVGKAIYFDEGNGGPEK